MVIFDDRRFVRDDGSLEFKENQAFFNNTTIVELLDGIRHCCYQLRIMKGKEKEPLYLSYQKMLSDYRQKLMKCIVTVGKDNMVLLNEYKKL